MDHDFKPGTEVAHVYLRSGVRRITKRVVDQVDNSARFTLVPIADEAPAVAHQKYAVGRYLSDEARAASRSSLFKGVYLEVWTDRHDREIGENQ